MLTFELIECQRCGQEVRRKRLGQRYCDEQCRNAAVQDRKRRKQARSGDKKSPTDTQKRRLVSPYLEAVTYAQKTSTKSYPYASPKVGVHPRPVVDLVGIEPELLAYIIKTETGVGE